MARVSVGKIYHALYQEVTKKDHGQPPLFATMKDFFMYNFAIGVRNAVTAAVEGSVDVFGSEIFTQDERGLLLAVHLADTRDLNILDGNMKDTSIPASVLERAEQYAHAGAAITERRLTPKKKEVMFSCLLLDPDM